MKARVVCLLRGCPAAITTQVLRQKKREKVGARKPYSLSLERERGASTGHKKMRKKEKNGLGMSIRNPS